MNFLLLGIEAKFFLKNFWFILDCFLPKFHFYHPMKTRLQQNYLGLILIVFLLMMIKCKFLHFVHLLHQESHLLLNILHLQVHLDLPINLQVLAFHHLFFLFYQFFILLSELHLKFSFIYLIFF